MLFFFIEPYPTATGSRVSQVFWNALNPSPTDNVFGWNER
jgi:hypothetical protein